MTENASGRTVKTRGARIAGVVSCVPENIVDNDHFITRFGQSTVDDIVKMIGVKQRRWADEKTTTRDLCRQAGERLLQTLQWPTESVDAILFVSQTPDYRLPATACALHADWKLKTGTIAFDVNLGCSGYPYALWLGMSMIQGGAARRVLLAVGETSSKIIDHDDRSTALVFGDAGTVTALEASHPNDEASFILGTDGAGVENLIIAKSGCRMDPSGRDPRLEGKRPEFLFMDGGEIFNFTLRAVPPLIASTLEFSGVTQENHHAFLFHQANLFMLKHLTKKAKLPPEQVPINIDQYGNTSSASIPLLLTSALGSELTRETRRIAMFGFGVGYSWASASLNIGPLECAETITYQPAPHQSIY